MVPKDKNSRPINDKKKLSRTLTFFKVFLVIYNTMFHPVQKYTTSIWHVISPLAFVDVSTAVDVSAYKKSREEKRRAEQSRAEQSRAEQKVEVIQFSHELRIYPVNTVKTST